MLLALARSAGHLQDQSQALKLVRVLGRYLCENPLQRYNNSSSIRNIKPSPWQVSTKCLVRAIIELQSKFGYDSSVLEESHIILNRYLEIIFSAFLSPETFEDPSQFFPVLFSIQGFLEGVSSRVLLLPYSFINRFLFKLKEVFTTDFFLTVESTVGKYNAKLAREDYSTALKNLNLSSSSDHVWEYYVEIYARSNLQLGALQINYYICQFTHAVSAKLINSKSLSIDLFDLLTIDPQRNEIETFDDETVQLVLDLTLSQITNLDEGADYIELGSPEKINLAYSMKASALQVIGALVHLKQYPADEAVKLVVSSISHDYGMSNPIFAVCVFKLASLLILYNDEIGSIIIKYLSHFITIPTVTSNLVKECAGSLVFGLKTMSQDVVVSTIYTLINALAVDPDTGSAVNTISRTSSMVGTDGTVTEAAHVNLYRNAITAVVAIASKYGDEQVAGLACTVLNQKVNSSVALDREVFLGMCDLIVYVSEKEFRTIWKSFSAFVFGSFKSDSTEQLALVSEVLGRLSGNLKTSHYLYDTYLVELLQSIVNRGDVHEHRPQVELYATAKEIGIFLPPLARLLPELNEPPYETPDDVINNLFRNAWFNMVVHGFSKNSEWTSKYQRELEIIARSTPPLVSEVSTNKIESELELNTVLQRGSSHHNVNNQKEIVESITPSHLFDFRSVHYPKLMFLSATVLLESLRANTGNCSKSLLYFGDPGIRSGDTRKYMGYITMDVVKAYITNVIKGGFPQFSIKNVAAQLKEMLILCCHRVKSIQDIAFECCDVLIASVPSSLAQKTSLFALLDLLTLLWRSCLDADTDEYEPRAIFYAKGSDISLELSDSYDHRRDSLNRFLTKAREWTNLALSSMNFDVKNLLTAYLNEMNSSRPLNDVSLGFTFALEMGGSVTGSDRELAAIARSNKLSTNVSSGFLSQFLWSREIKALPNLALNTEAITLYDMEATRIRESLAAIDQAHREDHRTFDKDLISKASGFFNHETEGRNIARLCVRIPFKVFTESSIQFGITLWLWAINENPSLKPLILSEVSQLWEWSVSEHLGIYTRRHDLVSPENAKMEYAPSNKAEVNHNALLASREFSCHQQLIRFLSSAFKSSIYGSSHFLKVFTRLLQVALEGLNHASFHPLSRTGRFELIQFATDVLEVHVRLSSSNLIQSLKDLIVTSALTWFAQPAQWPFGGNRLKLSADIELISKIALIMKGMAITNTKEYPVVSVKRDLLLFFMTDELAKMTTWADPLQNGPSFRDGLGKKIIPSATVSSNFLASVWKVDSVLAVYLVERYNNADLIQTLQNLIATDPVRVLNVPEALTYFLRARTQQKIDPILDHQLLYWTPVSPIDSINLFLPNYHADSLLLQYAMRSLESHDVNITFFYVPQLVQSLRYDIGGYVERYILETAQISQLFAHQIIWNILANKFEEEDVPDGGIVDHDFNPVLQRVVNQMTSRFLDEDKNFYNREFDFFNKVTGISQTLRPLVKKSKAEKKAKIDEEIAKINVDVGVYLPSNPDGIVIDIDRKSGRPLQSHAKTPFMATFKIRKEIQDFSNDDDLDTEEEQKFTTVDTWQGAIFKVGDDCRQDVLALQIISVFRSIFNSYGLDLYVFPYRVTATAPGCGVIDVLPNSISRDMLGREAVNGLYEYFTSKHGGEDSIQFQRARNNFVKSLAAYSVISYLIQFKDRHNGNIMYDDQGHLLHIDFGFCFDIVPGGVKFEAAPFKLTHEMVAVMGGSIHTQAYRWFEELCVKAFLSCRPHSETIIKVVLPMLGSGLPCFKGETTIKKLRARFVLEKTEREAAIHFRGLIKKSFESVYTKGYDEFQRITNGIPY